MLSAIDRNHCPPSNGMPVRHHRNTQEAMALRRFVIERDIPKVGSFEREQLRGAAAKSNEVLHQLGPGPLSFRRASEARQEESAVLGAK